MGDTPAIIAKASGLNSRIVSIAATSPKSLAIVSKQLSRPEELKGKKIGVTKGSYAHHLLVLVLERAHLSVNDVQIIHLPPADLVNAFNAGELDAAATWEPYLSRIEVGPVKRVADGTGIKQGALVIIAMEQFAKQNPELIGAFLRAYQRGHTYLKEQPKAAGELIASEIKLDAEQFQKLLPNFDYSPAITAAIHQELAGTEQFLRTNGLSKGPVDIETFVDDTYVRAAGINK